MTVLIIVVARYFIILPMIVALATLWRVKTKSLRVRYVIMLAATGGLALAIASICTSFIIDPRPFVVGHFTPLIPHPADNGFPSDHTLLAAAVGFATLPLSRKLGCTALVLAALIGAARVLAGVHHVEDIVGSFIITAAAAVVTYWLLHMLKLPLKPKQNGVE